MINILLMLHVVAVVIWVGVPALSIPCGFSPQRLPVGLQLQGKPFAEATLLRAAHQYQQITDHWQQIPDLPPVH